MRHVTHSRFPVKRSLENYLLVSLKHLASGTSQDFNSGWEDPLSIIPDRIHRNVALVLVQAWVRICHQSKSLGAIVPSTAYWRLRVLSADYTSTVSFLRSLATLTACEEFRGLNNHSTAYC